MVNISVDARNITALTLLSNGWYNFILHLAPVMIGEWKQTCCMTIHNFSLLPRSSHLWIHPLQWKHVGSQLPTHCFYCWRSQRMLEAWAHLAQSPGSRRIPLQAVVQQDLLEANYQGLRKMKWVWQAKGWLVTYQQSMGKGNILCVWRKWSCVMVLQWITTVWETGLGDREIPDIYLWFCCCRAILNPEVLPPGRYPMGCSKLRKTSPLSDGLSATRNKFQGTASRGFLDHI